MEPLTVDALPPSTFVLAELNAPDLTAGNVFFGFAVFAHLLSASAQSLSTFELLFVHCCWSHELLNIPVSRPVSHCPSLHSHTSLLSFFPTHVRVL